MLEYNREQILHDMADVLDDWGVKWEYEGVEASLDAWAKKKEWLINILRRHPNWNERAMGVVFTTEEERVFNEREFWKYFRALTIQFNTISFDDYFNNDLIDSIVGDHKFLWEPNKRSYYLSKIYDAIKNTSDLSTKASAQLIDNIVSLELDPAVTKNFKVGMKTSRIINALLEYLYNHNNQEAMRYYNQNFAKCADALNPMKVIKYTILSVHPADFLNMSYGTGWESCHSLDGCYRAGTLSYINDACSMILYTISSDYVGDEFFAERKINRQIYCLGEDFRLLQSRLYPQNESYDTSLSDNFRSNVQAILSTCLDIPNLWVKSNKPPSDFFKQGYGNKAYPDWLYPDSWYVNVSYPKGADIDDGLTEIGGTAYCLICGNEISEIDDLYCYNCDEDTVICSRCGEVISNENDYTVIDGEVYCYDCCFWCDYHEEYEPINNQSDYLDDICQEGFDLKYYVCDYCDEVIDKVYDSYAEINGFILCEEHYTICPFCGEPIPLSEEVANRIGVPFYTDEDGEPICEDCYDRLQTEENQPSIA